MWAVLPFLSFGDIPCRGFPGVLSVRFLPLLGIFQFRSLLLFVESPVAGDSGVQRDPDAGDLLFPVTGSSHFLGNSLFPFRE